MALDYLLEIARTPAPTFSEAPRGALVRSLWEKLGAEVSQDGVGNVIAELGPAGGQALVLAAHLDTVFGPEVPLTFTWEEERLVGPGIGDNSSSLAVLTALLAELDRGSLKFPLWLVGNVGEEGLGDLRGIKHLLAERGGRIGALIAVDGYLGQIVEQPVGVRRYRATFRTPGGHSWGDSGPSAVHALALAVSWLYQLPKPEGERSTLNVGTVRGGTTVNSIAAEAELLLDLRSLSAENLAQLEAAALRALQGAAEQVSAQLELELVGDRPAGSLHNAGLASLVRRAAKRCSLELRAGASSTDANAAALYQIPAVGLGVYQGGHSHRRDEWVNPGSLERGRELLQQVVALYQEQAGALYQEQVGALQSAGGEAEKPE